MSDEPGLFEVMYTCRAMRRIKPDPVPEELLVKLVESGNQAPTGSNVQNVRWLIVRDAETKRQLAEENRKHITAYMAADRVEELPHQSKAKRDRMREAVIWQMEHMHEIPALVIGCLEFDEPQGEAARAGGGGYVWPAVQNVLLAARALGLGATPTTLALRDRDRVKAILGLPETVEAYCLLPVGYPMGNFGPVTRLPVEETLHWDRW